MMWVCGRLHSRSCYRMVPGLPAQRGSEGSELLWERRRRSWKWRSLLHPEALLRGPGAPCLQAAGPRVDGMGPAPGPAPGRLRGLCGPAEPIAEGSFPRPFGLELLRPRSAVGRGPTLCPGPARLRAAGGRCTCVCGWFRPWTDSRPWASTRWDACFPGGRGGCSWSQGSRNQSQNSTPEAWPWVQRSLSCWF